MCNNNKCRLLQSALDSGMPSIKINKKVCLNVIVSYLFIVERDDSIKLFIRLYYTNLDDYYIASV